MSPSDSFEVHGAQGPIIGSNNRIFQTFIGSRTDSRDAVIRIDFNPSFDEYYVSRPSVEMKAIHQLEDRRRVLLTGPPGIGKTSTAERIWRSMSSAPPRLFHFSNSKVLATQISAFVKEKLELDSFPGEAEGLLPSALSRGSVDELIILDSVDQQTEISTWLSGWAGRIIITCRHHLLIPVEEIELEPFDGESSGHLAKLIGVNLSEQQIARIHEVSGGLPVLVSQLALYCASLPPSTTDRLISELEATARDVVTARHPLLGDQPPLVAIYSQIEAEYLSEANSSILAAILHLCNSDGVGLRSLIDLVVTELADRDTIRQTMMKLRRLGWLRWDEVSYSIHSVTRGCLMEHHFGTIPRTLRRTADVLSSITKSDQHPSEVELIASEYFVSASMPSRWSSAGAVQNLDETTWINLSPGHESLSHMFEDCVRIESASGIVIVKTPSKDIDRLWRAIRRKYRAVTVLCYGRHPDTGLGVRDTRNVARILPDGRPTHVHRMAGLDEEGRAISACGVRFTRSNRDVTLMFRCPDCFRDLSDLPDGFISRSPELTEAQMDRLIGAIREPGAHKRLLRDVDRNYPIHGFTSLTLAVLSWRVNKPLDVFFYARESALFRYTVASGILMILALDQLGDAHQADREARILGNFVAPVPGDSWDALLDSGSRRTLTSESIRIMADIGRKSPELYAGNVGDVDAELITELVSRWCLAAPPYLESGWSIL